MVVVQRVLRVHGDEAVRTVSRALLAHCERAKELLSTDEQVTVTASELTVRKVSHHGRIRQWSMNPVWVRLDRDEHEEFGIERLFLVSQGRRLAIAGFLGPQEKESFAHALTCALGEAKRGPTRTVFD